MSKSEADKVLEKYGITKNELPMIYITDAALKDMRDKIKVGDVIKIIRDSPTAGKSEYYRVVIDVPDKGDKTTKQNGSEDL